MLYVQESSQLEVFLFWAQPMFAVYGELTEYWLVRSVICK